MSTAGFKLLPESSIHQTSIVRYNDLTALLINSANISLSGFRVECFHFLTWLTPKLVTFSVAGPRDIDQVKGIDLGLACEDVDLYLSSWKRANSQNNKIDRFSSDDSLSNQLHGIENWSIQSRIRPEHNPHWRVSSSALAECRGKSLHTSWQLVLQRWCTSLVFLVVFQFPIGTTLLRSQKANRVMLLYRVIIQPQTETSSILCTKILCHCSLFVPSITWAWSVTPAWRRKAGIGNSKLMMFMSCWNLRIWFLYVFCMLCVLDFNIPKLSNLVCHNFPIFSLHCVTCASCAPPFTAMSMTFAHKRCHPVSTETTDKLVFLPYFTLKKAKCSGKWAVGKISQNHCNSHLCPATPGSNPFLQRLRWRENCRHQNVVWFRCEIAMFCLHETNVAKSWLRVMPSGVCCRHQE